MEKRNKDVLNYCISKLDQAVVFLDCGAAEYFHWADKKQDFLTCGAQALLEFSSRVVIPPYCHKAVFLLSDLLWTLPDANNDSNKSPTAKRLFHILSESSTPFTEVSLFTSCSFNTLSISHNIMVSKISGNSSSFSQSSRLSESEIVSYWRQIIQKWTNNENCHFEMEHVPFGVYNLLPEVLMLSSSPLRIPQFDMDVLQHSWLDQSQKQPAQLNAHSFLQIKVIVDLLNNLMNGLEVKEEVYTMGPLSEFVGSELVSDSSAKNRRKKHSTSASLILVDRLLDLHSITSVCRDHLLDCFYRRLLPLNHSENDQNRQSTDDEVVFENERGDIRSDVSVALGRHLAACGDDGVVCSGYLCPCDGEEDTLQLWRTLINSQNIKESILLLHKRLQSVLDDCGLAEISSPSSANVVALLDHLNEMVKLLKSHQDSQVIINNLPLLMYVIATLQVHKEYEETGTSLKTHKPSQMSAPITNVSPLQLQGEKNFLMAATDPAEQEDLLVEFLKKEKLSLPDDVFSQRDYNLDSGFESLISYFSMMDPKHKLSTETNALMKNYLSTALERELAQIASAPSRISSRLIVWLRQNYPKKSDHVVNVDEWSQYLMKFLHLTLTMRSALIDPNYRNSISSGALPETVPLVTRIVRDVRKANSNVSIGASMPSFQDLHLKSSGLRDMLKSGWGYLMSTSRSSPAQNEVIVICVLGSICFHEMRSFLQAVASSKTPNPQKIYLAGLGVERGDFHFLDLSSLS